MDIQLLRRSKEIVLAIQGERYLVIHGFEEEPDGSWSGKDIFYFQSHVEAAANYVASYAHRDHKELLRILEGSSKKAKEKSTQ